MFEMIQKRREKSAKALKNKARSVQWKLLFIHASYYLRVDGFSLSHRISCSMKTKWKIKEEIAIDINT